MGIKGKRTLAGKVRDVKRKWQVGKFIKELEEKIQGQGGEFKGGWHLVARGGFGQDPTRYTATNNVETIDITDFLLAAPNFGKGLNLNLPKDWMEKIQNMISGGMKTGEILKEVNKMGKEYNYKSQIEKTTDEDVKNQLKENTGNVMNKNKSEWVPTGQVHITSDTIRSSQNIIFTWRYYKCYI